TRRAAQDIVEQPAQVPPGADGDAGAEDSVPVPPDRSGWTPHPSERRDFFNRIRAFPPDIAAWRRQMQARVADEPQRFPLAVGLEEEGFPAALDAGISFLREIARILAILHGTPDLGNKQDPTDELVYILLARHTREGAYQQAYEALKRRFATWDELLDAPREE